MIYQARIARAEVQGVPMYVVAIINRLTRKMVTIGQFHFRAEAERWADDTITRRAWRNASELPDAWDRSRS